MSRIGSLKKYALAAAAMCAIFGPATAQDKYPSRPVKIVVALGAGSATDIFARMLAESLHQELKGDFIVENKSGAGGTIGGTFIVRAKPDGYTIGVLHSSVLTSMVAITPNLPYDPRKDFTYIGKTVSNPVVLGVSANSRYKTLDDLISAAKKDPGKVTAGIIGVGSHSHFNLELLKIASGADITRVAYSVGTTPAITGLLGGEIDSTSIVWAGMSEFVKAGRIRIIAATSPLKGVPDIPTYASLGYPRSNLEVFLSVVGPAGLPKEVTDALVPAVERAVRNPKNVAMMEKLGYRVDYENPKQLADTVAKELVVVTEVARKAAIVAE
jgi:tripartite-type tricarboxylate transporter receptor subunit TctC